MEYALPPCMDYGLCQASITLLEETYTHPCFMSKIVRWSNDYTNPGDVLNVVQRARRLFFSRAWRIL